MAQGYREVGIGMKHKKEWYTCDRCGSEIFETPSDAVWERIIGKKRLKISELEVLTAEKRGFVSDKYLVSPEIASVEITEFCAKKSRKIHLCEECRKEFERFIKMEV